MEQNSDRNHVFLLIIDNMKDIGYIEYEEVLKLKSSYSRYINDIKLQNEQYIAQNSQTINDNNLKNGASINDEYHDKTPLSRFDDMPKEEYRSIINGQYEYPNSQKFEPETIKTLTKEEIRERNLTWILNIG